MRIFLLGGIVAAAAAVIIAPAAFAAEPVAEFQTFLNDRNCNVGTADGQWGAMTTQAAAEFSDITGIAIARPVTPDLLAQLSATTAKCGPVDVLSHLVPADVLAKLQAARDGGWQCPVNTISLDEVLASKPVKAISGMQSNYNNQHDLPGYDTLLKFVPSMSGFFARGLITDDAELKTTLVNKLADWAKAGAFTKTIDCSPQGGLQCGQPWQTASGDDPAPSYDFFAVQYQMVTLAMGYYALLADFEPQKLAKQHRAIQAWLDVFTNRIDRGDEVLLGAGGMNFQWPLLIDDLRHHRDAAVEARLNNLAASLDGLVLEDGSLKDKTTRGSRATGYHFGALNSLLVGLEGLKANGIDLYSQYGERLHKAVKIFLDALEDPTTIYPWAQVNLESPGDPKVQEFTIEKDLRWSTNAAGLYIYMYRFPQDTQTARLSALLGELKQLHDQDSTSGLGLQCMYIAAMPELGGWVAPLPPPLLEYTGVSLTLEEEREDRAFYVLKFEGPKVDGQIVWTDTYQVSVKFDGKLGDLNKLTAVEMEFGRSSLFQKGSRQADYTICSPDSARQEGDDQWLQLYFGGASSQNRCLLEQMTPQDKLVWEAILGNFQMILDDAKTGTGAKHAEALQVYYDKIRS